MALVMAGRFTLLLLVALWTMVEPTIGADCNNKCCRSVRVPPLSKQTICDPGCKTACEAAKKVNAPDWVIPPSTVNEVVKAFESSCSLAFDVFSKAVIVSQGPYPAGSERLIDLAKTAVIRAGAVSPDEFANVHVRWCKIKGAGMAPDRNTVCLSDDYLRYNDLLNLATTLAHEMYHIRQYRSAASTDAFKCAYSQAYVNCAGCQDNGHPMEAEAYAFENQVGPAIGQAVLAINPPTAYRCVTPTGGCTYPRPVQVGTVCFCPDQSSGMTRE